MPQPSSLRKTCLAFDLFGRPFNFRMLHGYSTHRSLSGSCLTIVLFLIAVAYSISKLEILINHKEPKLAIWQYENVLDVTTEFSMREHGYTFAFGLINMHSYENFNNPDYGAFNL